MSVQCLCGVRHLLCLLISILLILPYVEFCHDEYCNLYPFCLILMVVVGMFSCNGSGNFVATQFAQQAANETRFFLEKCCMN